MHTPKKPGFSGPITSAGPVHRPERGVALDGVTCGYAPGRAVLRGVSARLQPCRLTALLGPNASGKSTLLKTVLGQLQPQKGSARVDGRPVGALGAAERARRIAYVPQRGGVGFAYRVRQVVAMGRFAFRDEAFVDAALNKLDLTDEADRVFAELSGGQQRRVLLARAWAQSRGPEGQAPGGGVVLADEPDAGLDLQHAHAAMGVLRELAREGVAVLVVLHGLELAEGYADEVWLMDRGRIVARGPRAEVMRPEVLDPVYGVALGEARDGERRVFYVRGQGAVQS